MDTIFFGEPDLESIGFANTDYFGKIQLPPYGTTPHPNILAGFIVFSLVTLFLSLFSPLRNVRSNSGVRPAVYTRFHMCSHIVSDLESSPTLLYVTISLSIIILLLTQSLAAIAGFLCVLIGYQLIKFIIIRYRSVILLAGMFSILILAPLSLDLIYHYTRVSDNHSVLTRYELNQAAISLIKAHPATGIGPNQFPLYLSHAPIKGQKTLFLQPVHNLLLLILTETGMIGFFLLNLTVFTFYRALKHSRKIPGNPALLLPLGLLLLIGSVDHYPLTLQTGQLLLSLAVTFPLLPETAAAN